MADKPVGFNEDWGVMLPPLPPNAARWTSPKDTGKPVPVYAVATKEAPPQGTDWITETDPRVIEWQATSADSFDTALQAAWAEITTKAQAVPDPMRP
jgi:hypothetical protein